MPSTIEVDNERSLSHLLKGVFAYSYSGYLVPQSPVEVPPEIPEIGSYLERTRPATTIGGQRGWELYDEIDGYVLVDYVGWIDFHGDGHLSGGGTSQCAGRRPIPFTHSGKYVVENAQPPMFTDVRVASSCVMLTHAESCNSSRELKFTLLDGDAGKMLASGKLIQG